MFGGDIPNKHFYKHRGRGILWFYAHFRMIAGYTADPTYDNYWFFDDDVTIEQPDLFFDGFKNVNKDFLAYYTFKHPDIYSNPDVPAIDRNTYSGKGWFDRFPGPGDILHEDTNELYGSFFPIVRLSNKALQAITSEARLGIYGYSEGFVPTILNYYGYSIGTIFGNDSKSLYFDQDKVQVKHKHHHNNWSWI